MDQPRNIRECAAAARGVQGHDAAAGRLRRLGGHFAGARPSARFSCGSSPTWDSWNAAIAIAASSLRGALRTSPHDGRRSPAVPLPQPRMLNGSDWCERARLYLFHGTREEARSEASTRRCDDGELYLQYSASEAFGFDDGRLKTADYSTASGFGLRGRARRPPSPMPTRSARRPSIAPPQP
jgi:hypothetical protein